MAGGVGGGQERREALPVLLPIGRPRGPPQQPLVLLLFLLLPLCWGAASIHLAAAAAGDGDDAASDREALMEFKGGADAEGKLGSWAGEDECAGEWYGVECDGGGRVSRLVLEGLSLVGPIAPLARLRRLRRLSLHNNLLNGSLPDFANWTILRSLYLSNNAFSGPIPDSISAPWRLSRLDLSYNSLSGAIPPSLAHLPLLLTLRLQNNRLSGPLPPNLSSIAPHLHDFNVSHNSLAGPIPFSLSNFSASSFVGNPGLCGAPLLICAPARAPEQDLGSGGVVSSTASTIPINAGLPPSEKRSPVRLGTGALVAVVVGDVAVVLLISFVSVLYFWRRCGAVQAAEGDAEAAAAEEEKGSAKINKKKMRKEPAEQLRAFDCVNYSQRRVDAAAERGKQLVFMDGGGRRQFELEDLLRASAEMLGKGTFGTTYRAVLEDGTVVVAVKRLKDWSSGTSRREFEQHMEIVGRLRHPNVVSLQAYYYAHDEKLLVYDYLPSGNLYALLHGNRGPGRTPLDWASRVKIALGVARGLAFVHHHLRPYKLPHGNVKSTNVLIDKHGNACLSDVGLAPMADPSSLATKLVGYRAPEHVGTKRVSQKGDVYSFGVLLLEILTGRAPAHSLYVRDGMDLPRWVQSVVQEEWTAEVFDLELLRYKNIEEEMVAMLQIAMQCACEAAEQRPRMSQVVRMIEGVAGEEEGTMGGGGEMSSSDAVSMSPSVSDKSGICGGGRGGGM